jgi:hypothetical protein
LLTASQVAPRVDAVLKEVFSLRFKGIEGIWQARHWKRNAELLPAALAAETVKSYSTPFVKPVKV